MSARTRERLRQALATYLTLGLLVAGVSHGLSGPSPASAAAATQHSSHHSPPQDRAPARHHNQCCDLCTVHCASHLGPVRIVALAASISLVVAFRVVGAYRVRPISRIRYHLPPSQAPPALLG